MHPLYTRVRPWLPVVFFFGGFAWDALTLGRTIKSSDLFILLGYLLVIAESESGAAVGIVMFFVEPGAHVNAKTITL